MAAVAEKYAITVNVEGMDCANCALGLTRQLNKGGFDHVNVNFATGEVQIQHPRPIELGRVRQLIDETGYVYKGEKAAPTQGPSSIEKKFLFTLPFTMPLLLHMVLSWHWLHHPLVQMGLSLPVVALGAWHFGQSGFRSLRNGVPNMDVLIFIGSMSAFLYSAAGTCLYFGDAMAAQYLFFETSATIITLVLLGNVIEHRSVKQTTTAITALSQLQQGLADRIIKDGTERVPVSDLVEGNLVQLTTGGAVPVDGILTYGEVDVDESMMTGEALPITRSMGDLVLGGTVVTSGNAHMRVERVGNQTALSKIIDLVKNAQTQRPPIQRLGDRISAVFVPVVLGISAITFAVSFLAFHIGITQAIMQAIAVLVISCPCAMGLATPTAVMVGLGRSAQMGILFKGAESIETLSRVKTVVFDKTGTLTTGQIAVSNLVVKEGVDEQIVLDVMVALASRSGHPISRAVCAAFAPKAQSIDLNQISELKGEGMTGVMSDDSVWKMGRAHHEANNHEAISDGDLFLFRDGEVVASVRLTDQLRPDAKDLMGFLHKRGIRKVILSGDSKARCQAMADAVGVSEVWAEKNPAEKLALIDKWSAEGPTAMVGDGINDAAALTRATVGISMSDATQAAMNAAQVVVLGSGSLTRVRQAFELADGTMRTIRQNLFWAFAYNIIAIPVAAVGLLSPMVAALSMACSDVVVIGNAIRFKYTRIGKA